MSAEVPWISPDAPLEAAIRRLGRAGPGAPCLLVGEAGGAPLGIVTAIDLLRAALTTALEPRRLSCAQDAHPGAEALGAPRLFDEMACAARDLAVRRVMSSPVRTVRDDATAAQVMDRLIHERVQALPVVDAEGRALGVIHRSALVTALLEALARTEAGLPAGGG